MILLRQAGIALREFLGRFPVKVRRGLARGLWWSAYPHSAYWRLGGAEPAVDEALTRLAAKPGQVFWDIGAHYGIYSIGLARAVGPGGCVEAFEPDPISYRRLIWHRRLNRLKNLNAHDVAASAVTSVRRLYQYNNFGDTTSHLPFENEDTLNVPFKEISTVALDEWLKSGRIRPPHFVKIDAEGHGAAVLQGMVQTLETARPVLIVAIHSPQEHAGARTLLEAMGYTVDALVPEERVQLLASNFGELLCEPKSAFLADNTLRPH